MGSLVGFNISTWLTEKNSNPAEAAQNRALAHFSHMECKSIQIGMSRLDVWGRKDLTDRIHTLPNGSVLALIGSPVGEVCWQNIEESLLKAELVENFELPWEGRVILLCVSADGRRWTMWNDWLGSIPVFHAQIGDGRIASTLEPVIVAAAGYTPDDFFMPGLVSLLINGHFISDWTLYKGMKIVPADSASEWDENGFRSKRLWTVTPSQERWETSWDDLVDEMHELSHKAIADALKTQFSWILPLSSGLDSRLIAGVAADVGAEAYTFAWGGPETTDVIFSQQIAKKLDFPWKHINLPKNFLLKYTPRWAALFGSVMHFHGMYQMAFLDLIEEWPKGRIISGFVGEVVAGDGINDLEPVHLRSENFQLCTDWYTNWHVNQLKSAFNIPLDDHLQANALEYKKMVGDLRGSFFQKMMFLELWNRQRFFISFQSTLSDYWRGVATPFMDRTYARFCMSLPRTALENRRLLADVYRRYYGRLAVVPGTYANEPLLLTGRYLLNRRIAQVLPKSIRRGSFAGYENKQLRMDIESIQAVGRKSLWPLFETIEQLPKWIDVNQLEQDYQTLMHSKEDVLPLRRLQSVQTLAYRLHA